MMSLNPHRTDLCEPDCRVHPKPYYSDDLVTIYHGDCVDILPTIARGTVDLVLTDPPYNAGKDFTNDSLTREAYVEWCKVWFPLVRATCSRTIIFPGNGNLDIWFDVARPSAVGCWYKPGNTRSGLLGYEAWEPWLYWTGDNGRLGGTSVIRESVGEQYGVGGHPSPKPVGLMSKLLVKSKSAAVLDPFVGSGTTLVAAKSLGIRAIGIEIEERYCEVAATRCSQEVLGLVG